VSSCGFPALKHDPAEIDHAGLAAVGAEAEKKRDALLEVATKLLAPLEIPQEVFRSLLDAWVRRRLEEVPTEALPEEMQEMSRDEQHDHLRQKTAERENLRQRIATLVEQRDAYVAKETAKLEAEGKHDGFDAEVMESIRRQAVDYGIVY
jgi:hypothetical protein